MRASVVVPTYRRHELLRRCLAALASPRFDPGANEVIEILHFVGAADSFISRQFQAHFLRLGLRGGLIGGGAAILFFVTIGRVASFGRTTASGEQIEALFGTFGLEIRGYVAILLIAAGIAVLTGIVSRVIVYRHLRTLM